MINFIEGEIVSKGDGFVVIANNGIGYEIGVSNNTLVEISSLTQAKIYTYLQVREDGLSLYGFASENEKNVFLKLITVSGVGPKSAMVILSSLPLVDLIDCIVNENVALLSKAKGIGKKTAERIVLELKDKMDLMTTLSGLDTSRTQIPLALDDQCSSDAVELLTNLGINLQKAKQLVAMVRPECKTTEEIIKRAFEQMNG